MEALSANKIGGKGGRLRRRRPVVERGACGGCDVTCGASRARLIGSSAARWLAAAPAPLTPPTLHKTTQTRYSSCESWPLPAPEPRPRRLDFTPCTNFTTIPTTVLVHRPKINDTRTVAQRETPRGVGSRLQRQCE